MELTFNELKKRDVINVSDGRCLGRITDIRLRFPQGDLVGIVVPGRRSRSFFCFFDKSELYIDRNRIIKIGGDVILVNVNCGDVCEPTGIDKCSKNKCPPPPCPPPRAPKAPPSERCNKTKIVIQIAKII